MARRETRAVLLFVLVSLAGGAAYRAALAPSGATLIERLRALEEESRLDAERSAGARPVRAPDDSAAGDAAASGRPAARRGLGAAHAGGRKEASLGSLDPDRADAAEWERLPGIGPALAARIVADRAARGPFGGLAGLGRVRGIGPRTLERLRPYLLPAAVDSASPIAK